MCVTKLMRSVVCIVYALCKQQLVRRISLYEQTCIPLESNDVLRCCKTNSSEGRKLCVGIRFNEKNLQKLTIIKQKRNHCYSIESGKSSDFCLLLPYGQLSVGQKCSFFLSFSNFWQYFHWHSTHTLIAKNVFVCKYSSVDEVTIR